MTIIYKNFAVWALVIILCAFNCFTRCATASDLSRSRSREDAHQVIAAWYGWWGNPSVSGKWVHWNGVDPENHAIASSRYYPLDGAYDSHDPALLSKQISLAQSSGITAFAASWWGPADFTDVSLQGLLSAARKSDFHVTAYFETIKPKRGQTKVDAAAGDLLYLLNQYAGSPAWLTFHGKPVVFIYGRALQQLPLDEWNAVVARVRANYPRGVALIADVGTTHRQQIQGSPALQSAAVFSGVHVYNITGETKGMAPAAVAAWARTTYAQIVATTVSNQPTVLTVIPGYDDSEISARKPPHPITGRFNGDTYKTLLSAAIETNPDWLFITSWNEWHEGSQIEPSYEFGTLYTDLTKQYAPGFLSQPPSSRRAALIRSLYGVVLGRAPDPTELARCTELARSMPLDRLYHSFFNSREYLNQSTGNEQYINQLYQCILLRTPDPSGLRTYTNALRHGRSRNAVLDTILHSAEFNQKLRYRLEQAKVSG